MHTLVHGIGFPLAVFLPPILLSAQRLRRSFRKKTDAEYVRTTREKLELTQAELADKLGMERRTVMRYETGEHPLPKHVRLALKQVLHEHKKRAARR